MKLLEESDEIKQNKDGLLHHRWVSDCSACHFNFSSPPWDSIIGNIKMLIYMPCTFPGRGDSQQKLTENVIEEKFVKGCRVGTITRIL